MINDENLSIGFIGAGRVVFTLARFFYEKNLPISGFFSRAAENRQKYHGRYYKNPEEFFGV